MMKKRLIKFFKRQILIKKQREKSLVDNFDELHFKWQKKVDRFENSCKKKQKDNKSREFYEKVFPELRKQREERERLIQKQKTTASTTPLTITNTTATTITAAATAAASISTSTTNAITATSTTTTISSTTISTLPNTPELVSSAFQQSTETTASAAEPNPIEVCTKIIVLEFLSNKYANSSRLNFINF